MKKLLLLGLLISSVALAQVPTMPPPPPPLPTGWCGQVFCPPPTPLPNGPCGQVICQPPKPIPPVPAPPTPAPPEPAKLQFLKVADTSHWHELTTTRTSTKVYIDDSTVLVEAVFGEKFNGFKALIVFPKPVEYKGISVQSEILQVMYSCHSNKSIAKRLTLIDDTQHDHPFGDGQWHEANLPPATEIAEAIKARVCFSI